VAEIPELHGARAFDCGSSGAAATYSKPHFIHTSNILI
jgi:hypothetical protein